MRFVAPCSSVSKGSVALLFAALLLPHATAHATKQPPRVAPPPPWVTRIDPPATDSEAGSQSVSSYCLLMDEQYDLASKCSYFHYAVKILNHQGVQDLSDISLGYDPSYQSLTFHFIRVQRGARVIDKLKTDAIRTFQRETNLERSMYDGSLTASVNLSDIRIGDVIEYAFTRCGQHPAYGNHNFGALGLETLIPVELYNLRLRVPDDSKVAFRQGGQGVEADVGHDAGNTVYQWSQHKLKAMEIETNVPRWYFIDAAVRYTDYRSWNEVVYWAIPLFEVSGAERDRLQSLAGEAVAAPDKPASILKAIRFVQNEIRYLALEEGMNAYQPHPPTQVWDQRYGDCKDKTLLLCALLYGLGVEAHPMLVNTSALRSEEAFIMAPGDFDHCVVTFVYDGERYYVDPTASHQGGDLQHMSFSDFQFGLIVAPFTTGLTALPEPETGSTVVTERFQLDGAGGAALSVHSEYSGRMADFQRAYFAMTDPASIQKGYVAFYAVLYPEIKASVDVSYADDRRGTDNVFTVDESYQISHIWSTDSEDTTIKHVEFLPMELKQMTEWESGPGRKMPYELSRTHRRHEIIIEGPQHVYIEPEQVSITGDVFEYAKKVTVAPGAVDILHEYRCTGSYIEAPSVAGFVSKHDEIRTRLPSVVVDTNLLSEGNGRLSWTMLALVVLAGGVSIWGARRVYVAYDPEPRMTEPGPTIPHIGGWLLLPALGLVVATLRELAGLADIGTVLDAGFLSSLNVGFLIFMGAAAILSVAGPIIAILLSISFLKRRTSTPALFVVYMGVNLVATVASGAALADLSEEPLFGPGGHLSASVLFWQVVYTTMWTLYFLRSKRVKRTFVERGPAHRADDRIPDPIYTPFE